MLPTCGGYACEGMWRAEVYYVMGETAGKNPPSSSSPSLLEVVGDEDLGDLTLQRALVAPEVSGHR